MPLLLGKETVMGQELVFNYKKSFCFLFFGAGSVFLAAFLMAPMILCSCYWNWQWFVHWWYLYIFPNVMGLILLAFGMLFPNQGMFVFPFPFPIKAKYFVIIYILIELLLGFQGHDNVAHFAHLGGMLFGFLLIKYWRKKNKNEYYY